MKAFNGYTGERSKKGGYPQLPAGPYVGKIMNVKLDGLEPDQSLVLLLDVTEGDFANYYAKRFAHDDLAYKNGNSKYEPKYKGTLFVTIPNQDSRKRGEYYESDLRNFNNAMACIMASNPGYTWDWNEAGLKGLSVGFSVRQGTYNGNQFTKIVNLEDANEVRMGQVETLPPMEPRSNGSSAVSSQPPVYQPPMAVQPPQQINYTQVQGGYTPVTTEELQF